MARRTPTHHRGGTGGGPGRGPDLLLRDGGHESLAGAGHLDLAGVGGGEGGLAAVELDRGAVDRLADEEVAGGGQDDARAGDRDLQRGAGGVQVEAVEDEVGNGDRPGPDA